MSESQQQTLPFLQPPQKSRWRNQVIEAGAGTGKTTRIVRDVVLRLLDDEELRAERLVLMTFTEKAAAEISERIRWALVDLGSQLDSARLQWPSGAASPVIDLEMTEARRRAVRTHLAQIDRIRSQTIHSFCQTILRLYPLEAGLDPQFEIVQGYERMVLMSETYDRWLRDTLNALPEPEWFMPAFRKLKFLDRLRGAVFAAANRRELLQNETLSLGDIHDFEAVIIPHLDVLTALSALEIESLAPEVGDIVERIRSQARPASTPEEWIAYLQPLQKLAKNMELRRGGKELKARVNPAIVLLRVSADMVIGHGASEALRQATLSFLGALDREKQRRGAVDFDDLLLLTASLLEDDATAERVRTRFDLMFVDEFQDTDRVQAAIVNRLSRDASGALLQGRVTLVGDPKQSIYSFRRADPETFARLVAEFVAEGAERARLDRQYRSDPELLGAINAMFGSLFPSQQGAFDAAQRPPYYPLEAARNALRSPDQARVRFLGVDAAGDADIRAEAEAVAELIGARIERGAAPRSFAILLRKLKHVSVWTDVFERHGIDLEVPPGRTLLERRAVVDLTAFLRALAYPFDEGAAISAARSPYVASTDTDIAHSLMVDRNEHPASLAPLLRHYGAIAERVTIGELVDQIIDDSRVETIYRLTRNGERDLRHLRRFRSIIDEYDLLHGGSLRAFIDEIDRRRDAADEAEPPAVEDATDAVRLMTVHASKGLEFDVVILPELGARMGNDTLDIDAIDDPPSLIFRNAAESFSAQLRFMNDVPLGSVVSGRDEAEVERLFYVAVTRAKEEVVFVTPLQKIARLGFWKPLNTIFDFDLRNFEQAFPKPGQSQLCETTLRAGAPFMLAYERAAVEQTSARRRSPFRDERIEAMARANMIPADPEPLPESQVLTRAEALKLLAVSRRRKAGIAMHRALELWNFESESVRDVAGRVRREMALTAPAAEAIAATLKRLAPTPNAALIRASSIKARETSLFDRGDDGRVREGRLDLLVRDAFGWVVVDFKTGSRWAGREEKDRAQVDEYCRRISALYGEECRGVVWYVDE